MNIVEDLNALRTISEPVASVEEATELIELLKKETAKREHCVGLAAIQIGVPKRVSVIQKASAHERKRFDEDDFICLINPKVVSHEEEFLFGNEGCMSFPGQATTTKRYRHFTIDNQVIDGDSFRTERNYYYHERDNENSDELAAIAVQHEIDHMDGLVIWDKESKSKPIVKGDKVGRNDKCPCGSGKKFKKCCINKELFD